jgi:hypothetical protein
VPVAVVKDGLHELVGDAHGVIGILILDRMAILAVEVHIESGVSKGACFAFFDGLAPDEVFDIGMARIEDHHLGGAPRFSA